MATFTPIRGTRAEIQATSMVDGQFLMETDQQDRSRIYMDTADGGTLERITVGRGTAQDLGDLDDVTLETPIENLSYLRYDSNSEEWIKDTTMVKSTNSDSEIWVKNKNYYVNNPVTNEADYVIDDNKLWVCIADNTSTDTNRPSYVSQTCWENVSLISLKNSLANIINTPTTNIMSLNQNVTIVSDMTHKLNGIVFGAVIIQVNTDLPGWTPLFSGFNNLGSTDKTYNFYNVDNSKLFQRHYLGFIQSNGVNAGTYMINVPY